MRRKKADISSPRRDRNRFLMLMGEYTPLPLSVLSWLPLQAGSFLHTTPPTRKALLASLEGSTLVRPLLLLAADASLFAGGSAIALLTGELWLKLIGTLVITAAIVRLFLIGHDACHGSFFANKTLNNVLGRIAFLPSMTAFSLWDVGHNVAHHGFNNLKGRDQVWAPFSKSEYDALPPHRKVLEHLYRSGFGWGAYYLVELWWKKLFFANRREIGSRRSQYKIDSVLVTVGAFLWIGAVALIARATAQSTVLLELLAVIAPFLLWNVIMGFVVYVHHTHPTIAWFQKRQEWQRCRAYLTATAHVRLPLGMGYLLHNIMEHNAHHMNPRIPMFALRAAQKLVRDRFAEEFRSYRLNWPTYLDSVRRCKLYDFVNHTWLDFRGVATSAVLVPLPA
jgi:omega-6 fatty acid desaturase (delta-12 desaturase)